MGAIVYKGLIRTGIAIVIIWFLASYLQTQFFWIIAATLFYLIVFHPAILQYKKFEESKIKKMEGTICATCRHYDETAVLCMKYDKHPTPDNIPCNGVHWEPKK